MSTVLRLITRLNVGGPARHALLLTKGLARDFPTVLAAGRTSRHEGELSDPEVPVCPLPLVRPLRPWQDGRAIAATRQLINETGARIVHTHMAKAGTVGRLASASSGGRPRTVHTFHGHVLDGYFRPLVQRSFLEVERRLARHTDVLVAVSPQVRDCLLELGVGRPSQFRVVPLGLELEPFLQVKGQSGQLRRQLGLAPETPLVGAVGRLVPIKDLTTLVTAMASLPEAHLVLIGDGESRSGLESHARTLGLAARVHFAGWWSDVAGAMSDIDVLALTSRNEGTPVSLIEALAAGKPVVATSVGGVPFVIDHRRTGMLVPVADPVALSKRVAELLARPDWGRSMGQAGREHVRTLFSRDRLLHDTRELYGELLGEFPPARSQPQPGR